MVKTKTVLLLPVYFTQQHTSISIAGIQAITEAFPDLKVLTSETDPIAPKHFGQKYFGTD